MTKKSLEDEIWKLKTGCGKTFRDCEEDEEEIVCGKNGFCSSCAIANRKIDQALALLDKTREECVKQGRQIELERIAKILSKAPKDVIDYLEDLEDERERGRREAEISILERAKQFNGMLKSSDEMIRFIERLVKCRGCGKHFWDKICPDCELKLIEQGRKEAIEAYNTGGERWTRPTTL